MVGASLCSVAGMLPDLDSKSGIPLREMLSFVSVIIPMLMLDRFRSLGLTPEYMVFVAGVMYVTIRFGIGGIFKRYTKHRGMWHSIPAAMIAGLATFFICLSPELGIRLFKAWAVVIGFLTHLLLDEIYSVDLMGERIRVKKSFGTALKWYSPSSTWANVSTYGKLMLMIFLVFSDHAVMEYFGHEPPDVPYTARDWLMHSLDLHNAESDPDHFHTPGEFR